MSVKTTSTLMFLALFLSAATLTGCPSSLSGLGWVYSLGSYEEGYDIAQTADGGYWAIARGRVKGDTTSEPQIIGAKLSAAGKVEWWKLIDGLYTQSAYAHAALGAVTSNGDFVLVGISENFTDTESRLLSVVRLDAQGQETWNKTYGQIELDPEAVTTTDDDGVIIAGLQHSPQSTFLLKLDAAGDIVWEKHFDPNVNSMTVYSMATVPSGGYILVGGSSGAEAFKTDSNGDQLWWNLYDEYWVPHGVGVASDGGFVVAGTSTKSGPAVPVIFRIDADGNLLWAAEDIIDRAASTHYTVKDSLVDEEGRIVLVGEAEKVEYIGNFFPIITDEAYIMQLDANANLNWYKSLGSGYVNGVTLTDSGDYITAGTTGTHLQVIRVGTDGKVIQ